jgi:hypothetical protein
MSATGPVYLPFDLPPLVGRAGVEPATDSRDISPALSSLSYRPFVARGGTDPPTSRV